MCSHPVPAKLMASDRPQQRGNWSTAAFYVLLFALYLCLNSVLNLANRWALGLSGFAFPVLLTMAHAIFSFSILGPVLTTMKVNHAATLRKSWKGIVVIGVLMGCNIACNNLSLVHLPLSLNQVTRASLPVVTAAVAVLVEKKVPSREECGALVLLTLGVTVTVFEGKATGSGSGLMLCVLGVLCAAAMLSTAGRVLSEKIDVLQLTFYTAPVSCLMLFPFYLYREHANFMIYLETNQRGVAIIIIFSSFVALAYNVTHNYLLQRTSAVTVTVLGEVKIVGLLLLSAMLLPGESSQFTLKMTVGCVLAVAGFCLYSNAKISAQRSAGPATPTPDPVNFSQEKLLELITAEGRNQLAGSGKQTLRSCLQVPLLTTLRQVVQRRGAVSSTTKLGKSPTGGTMFVVADSSVKDLEAAPLLQTSDVAAPPAAEGGEVLLPVERLQMDQAMVHSGYESMGGQLTHVNAKTSHQNGKNGYANGRAALGYVQPSAFSAEPGKVRSVPDISILDVPESMQTGPVLAPRSYEALQLFDSAPRGYSLAQPS